MLLGIFACTIAGIFANVEGQNFKRDPSQSMRFANFKKNPSTRLVSSFLSSTTVRDLVDCTFECISHPQCYSLNIGKPLDESYWCELIGTDMFKAPENLSASGNFDHYNIEVRCNAGISVLAVLLSPSIEVNLYNVLKTNACFHRNVFTWHLEVQSFFIYHSAGLIKESSSSVFKVLNFLTLLVLKSKMQQVPLLFAAS